MESKKDKLYVKLYEGEELEILRRRLKAKEIEWGAKVEEEETALPKEAIVIDGVPPKSTFPDKNSQSENTNNQEEEMTL